MLGICDPSDIMYWVLSDRVYILNSGTMRGDGMKPYGVPSLWTINTIEEDENTKPLRAHKKTLKLFHRKHRRMIRLTLKKMIEEEVNEEQIYQAGD